MATCLNGVIFFTARTNLVYSNLYQWFLSLYSKTNDCTCFWFQWCNITKSITIIQVDVYGLKCNKGVLANGSGSLKYYKLLCLFYKICRVKYKLKHCLLETHKNDVNIQQ